MPSTADTPVSPDRLMAFTFGFAPPLLIEAAIPRIFFRSTTPARRRSLRHSTHRRLTRSCQCWTWLPARAFGASRWRSIRPKFASPHWIGLASSPLHKKSPLGRGLPIVTPSLPATCVRPIFGQGHAIAILGHILHSEGEERSRWLLRKTFDALTPGGTIAIAEILVDAERRA